MTQAGKWLDRFDYEKVLKPLVGSDTAANIWDSVSCCGPE
jgi:hypothetical protein